MNKDLINTLYQSALEVEKKLGIPALFQIAQTIQESGWDIVPLIINGVNSYNIYGIKWHYGDKYVQTAGWDSAKYQVYESYEDCFRDHAQLLVSEITGGQNYSYNDCLKAFKINPNLNKYVTCIAKIYATDKNYAIKILNIIEVLKTKLGIKEVALKETTPYEQEIKEAEETLSKLGIMTDFRQPVTNERLAVILARLIKINFKSI
ncbi:MAG: glucosaminidase domain-containing protein [Bacteroidia bacterium]|nr:glucosaminidase domain-containing protein [Bacteroidia bacterium]